MLFLPYRIVRTIIVYSCGPDRNDLMIIISINNNLASTLLRDYFVSTLSIVNTITITIEIHNPLYKLISATAISLAVDEANGHCYV